MTSIHRSTDLRKAEIDLNGMTGRVVVDGMDISSCIDRIEIVGQVGDLPRLLVSMVMPKVSAQTEGRIALDADTREALVHLGWTAPALPIEFIRIEDNEGNIAREWVAEVDAAELVRLGWTPPAEVSE